MSFSKSFFIRVFNMRLGLLSDTHIPEAMSELWPQVFSELKDVDVILHAGDIHNYSLLDRLEKIAPVYAALGNGDEGSGGREGPRRGQLS